MPKWAALLGLLLLVSCSTSSPLAPPAGSLPPPPEGDTSAPGMIPPECEKLLDKSQAWGFQPDGRWPRS